jgi:hypothetical protein
LQHGEFIILTDHQSLSQLNEQRLHTPWQHKVFTKLLGLQYKIIYRQGHSNRVADALSRRISPEINVVSEVVPQWLTDVQNNYSHDPTTQSLMAKLALDPSAVPNFTLTNGLLRYKGRIWLGNDKVLQQRLVAALHTSPIGGHSGIPVTYSRLKNLFAWKNMKTTVQQFIQTCQICLQAKPDRSAYPRKLQPLPVPSGAWETITMDFIDGLPSSGHANCILVVVDKFTKYAHFIPLSHPYTASYVAQVFFVNVYKLHGLPSANISDRDLVFTSNFWQHLFKITGTDLKLSSSYHPKQMGRPSVSINVWKPFYAVSPVLVQKSGRIGCLQQSFGTIQACIHPSVVPHFKHCMADSLGPLVSLLMTLLQQVCPLGCRNAH